MRALDRYIEVEGPVVDFTFNGEVVQAVQGESVAAALISAGHLAQRGGRNSTDHGHFCGMGACFECLVSIDGVPGQRACMVPVRGDMTIKSQPYRAEASQKSDRDAAIEVPDAELPSTNVEVLIIGAGPAGLQAGLAARRAGAEVLIVDERTSPGGQYFKQLASAYGTDLQQASDRQMKQGRELARKVREAGAMIQSDTLVWGAFRETDSDIRIGIERAGRASILRPRALIVATGAIERPYPVPGWTLPGVMTTGGFQTLLRSYRSAPPGPIVVAGNGPLNMQVAVELVEAGVEVACVVESAQPFSVHGMTESALAAMRAPTLIRQGMSYLYRLRRAGVSVIYGHAVAAIHGTNHVESVELAPVAPDGSLGKSRKHVTAKAVSLGYGFLPQAEITRLLGVRHTWDGRDFGWISAVREDDGSSSVPGVFVAGEAGGFGGAHVAMAQGYLAGLAAARLCGYHHDDPQEAGWSSSLSRHRKFQRHMWSAFRSPLHPLAGVTPDTVVCRCEDVRAGEISGCADVASDFGAIKRKTRAGMGRCQGRYCAVTVRNLLAAHPLEPTELDLPAPQNPVKPLAAGTIAVEKGEWGGHKRITLTTGQSHPVRPAKTREARHADVTVIGAGIAGVCTALFLARAGVDVAVIDRKAPNSEASGGNAGSLHVQLMSFDFGSKAESGGGPAIQTLPLQQASARLWSQLAHELDEDIEFKITGGLMVAESKQQMAFLEEKAALERSLGIDTNVIDLPGVRQFLPGVSDSVIGGAWCSEEGKINPLLATPALVKAATAAGARFFIGETVEGLSRCGSKWIVETDQGSIHSQCVVNAAGAWAGSVAALVGLNVPVYGTPLQMIVTEAAEPMVDVLLSHADRHLTLKQATNGNLIIGGGWPSALSVPHGHPRPLLGSIEGNLWVAQHVLPSIRNLRILRSWSAINVNIDGAPILGEVPSLPGFYNAVTSSGYTLGPLVGQITADLIHSGRSNWSISSFALDRFNEQRAS